MMVSCLLLQSLRPQKCRAHSESPYSSGNPVEDNPPSIAARLRWSIQVPGLECPTCSEYMIIVTSYCYVLCLVTQLCLTLCGPMDCSPPDSSIHGDSPGKNTGVSCHSLLKGIFPTQRTDPSLPHCRDCLLSEPPGTTFLIVIVILINTCDLEFFLELFKRISFMTIWGAQASGRFSYSSSCSR